MDNTPVRSNQITVRSNQYTESWDKNVPTSGDHSIRESLLSVNDTDDEDENPLSETEQFDIYIKP